MVLIAQFAEGIPAALLTAIRANRRSAVQRITKSRCRIHDSGVQEIFPSLQDDPDGNGSRRALIMFGVGRALQWMNWR
jgi:hypothetical protein